MLIADDVWVVIVETLKKYKGIELLQEHRKRIEALAEIRPFDGGVVVIRDNEFDIFVTPQRRGKWPIKKIVKETVENLISKYGKAVVSIHKENKPSMRLAIGLGFVPVSESGCVVRLEKKLWTQ